MSKPLPSQIISQHVSKLISLDPVSWKIIDYLVLYPKSTRYDLKTKLSHGRSVISNRLDGSKKYIGLIKEYYLEIDETKEYAQSKYKQKMSLTFKGFIASLKKTSTTVNPLLDSILGHFSFPEVGYIKEYVEYEIALWLQTHVENGLELTYVKNMPMYYQGTRTGEQIFGNQYDNVRIIMSKASLDPNKQVEEIEKIETYHSKQWVKLLVERQEKYNKNIKAYHERKSFIDTWWTNFP